MAGWLRSRVRISIFSLLINPRGTGQCERAGRAVGRKFVNDLSRGVAVCKMRSRTRGVFEMGLCTGDGAAVIGKLARLAGLRCIEIAIKNVRFLVVNANIKRPVDRASNEAYGRIAIDRIKLVRLNIAKQTLASVLVRIVGQRQQVFALTLPLMNMARAHRLRAHHFSNCGKCALSPARTRLARTAEIPVNQNLRKLRMPSITPAP